MRRVVVALSLVVACTKPNPRSCADGTCTDPTFPFCDVNGEVDGENNTCVAVACTAGEFQACRGDLAITCNTAGSDFDLIQCDRGCEDGIGCHLCDPNETACTNGTVASCDANGTVTASQVCPLGCFEDQPRCREVSSSNNLDSFLDTSRTAADLDLSTGGTIDTSTGDVRDINNTQIAVSSVLLAAPANGSPIRVIVAGNVKIGNVQVNVSSFPGPALAIVSGGTVVVSGILTLWKSDREGVRIQPGAVDFAGCKGGDGFFIHNNSPSQDLFSGSGGGAHATAGGAGGAVSSRVDGGAAGTLLGNPTLIPLRGGCDGGVGVGGGGGAVQITSRTSISLTANAVINANGNLGPALFPGPNQYGGGGAGGGILLEAPSVDLGSGSRLLVNGGPAATGAVFEPAISLTTAVSVGGTCTSIGAFVCGNGGNGASADGPSTDGALIPYTNSASLTDFQAGGGGGGAGFIRINTATGAFHQTSDTIESGVLTAGTIVTR